MTEPTATPTRGSRRANWWLRGVVLVAIVILAVAAIRWTVGGAPGVIPSNASMIGAPVRATTDAGDRVFIMTAQHRSFGGFGRRSVSARSSHLLIRLAMQDRRTSLTDDGVSRWCDGVIASS